MSQSIAYEMISDDFEENVEHFSAIMRELTGEWIHYIECEDIQHESRFFYDEFVYFGPEDELN